MDVRAEAEKRYDDWAVYGGSVVRDAFHAGAAYALREFGDMLGRTSDYANSIEERLSLVAWEAEAKREADQIEADQ